MLNEESLSLVSATFTGRSSGQLMELYWRNEGTSTASATLGPYIIFTDDKHSPVWIEKFQVRVPFGASAFVTVKGFSLLPGAATNPAGRKIANIRNWYDPSSGAALGPEQNLGGFPGVSTKVLDPARELHLVFPGTDIYFPYQFDAYSNSVLYVRFLFEAERWIREAYPVLKRSGAVRTPLAFNPEMEQDYVQQVAIWMVSSLLTGVPFSDQLLNDELISKYAAGKDIKIREVPGDVRRQIRDGLGQIWDTALRLCIEANVVQRAGDVKRDMALTVSREGYCYLDPVERAVYIEDEAICEAMQGTFFRTKSEADEFVDLIHPSGVSLDVLNTHFSLQNALGFSGKLQGNWSKIKNLSCAFESAAPASVNGTVNPGTGEFVLPQVPLQPGQNDFTIYFDKPGTGKSVVARGSVALTRVRDRLRVGVKKNIGGLDLTLQEIGRGGICRISVDGESYTLAANQPVSWKNVQIGLESVDARNSEARIVLARRHCDNSVSKHHDPTDQSPECLFEEMFGEGIVTRTYQDLLLSNAFGFQQPGLQLGLISAFSLNTTLLNCGAYQHERLDQMLAGTVNAAMKSAFEPVFIAGPRMRVEVSMLEIDPFGRALLARSDNVQAQAGSTGPSLRISKKLANPDYIIDGKIHVDCCPALSDDPCGQVPVNIRLEAYLVETATGRVVSTFGIQPPAAENSRTMQCYDLLTANGRYKAEETMRAFSRNALQHFREYLGKHY